MHRIRYLLLSLAIILGFTSLIRAQDTGWVIDNFKSEIQVSQQASVEVKETILVDFDNLSKHGIFRTIPVDYKDLYGNKLNIRLKVKSVKNGVGRSIEYKVTRKGKTTEIKIGDPNKTISGKQTYVIVYEVQRVINSFDNHDELYWNITGNNWPVPILNAQAEISFPGRVVQSECFTGVKGSTVKSCRSDINGDDASFQATKTLYPGEGLTVVAGVEKGKIIFPAFSKKMLWFISDNWPYGLPLITLAILLWIYWQHGRDEQYKSIFDPTKGSQRMPLFKTELVPSTYAPLKDIKPAEAGTLVDEEVNIRDIAATLIDLAIRGYISIEEVKGKGLFAKDDYRLHLKEKDTTDLEEYEKKLLDGIFGKVKSSKSKLLSTLKYKFTTHLKKIRDDLYSGMASKKYFFTRPDRVVKIYRVAGGILAFLGFFFFSISLAWTFAFVISGLLIFIFSKAMPKRTALGRKQYLRVLGLRNFISIGAYRQQLWEKANLFEEVMPFAIALDLTHKWAAAFERISVKKPDWYQSSSKFNTRSFAYSMESFTRKTTSTLPVTKSASSGSSGFSGGSSGGGFGGGGGGSW